MLSKYTILLVLFTSILSNANQNGTVNLNSEYLALKMAKINDIDLVNKTITYTLLENKKLYKQKYITDGTVDCKNKKSTEGEELVLKSKINDFHCIVLSNMVKNQEYKLSGKEYMLHIKYNNEQSYKANQNGLIINIELDLVQM